MTLRTYPNLAAFFHAEGRIQNQVAHELGISSSLLSMIRWGLRQPQLDLALRISERCRVPLESLIRVRRPTPAKAASRPRPRAKIHSLHNTIRQTGGRSPGAARHSSQSEKNG